MYSKDSSFPLSPIAAVYSLGLIFLAIYAPIFRVESRYSPETHLQLAKGSRRGLIAVGVVSIPMFFILADLLAQRAIGLGFLLVGLGAIWIPFSSAALAYGRILANEDQIRRFVVEVRKSQFTFERISSIFLAFYLGRLRLSRKMSRTLIFLFWLLFLYATGWAWLTAIGGSPGTWFGLAPGIIVPFFSWLFFRRSVSVESRTRIARALEESLSIVASPAVC